MSLNRHFFIDSTPLVSSKQHSIIGSTPLVSVYVHIQLGYTSNQDALNAGRASSDRPGSGCAEDLPPRIREGGVDPAPPDVLCRPMGTWPPVADFFWRRG